MAELQTFSATVESAAASQGGTLGLGNFLRIAFDAAKQLAATQVDTEEERDALIERALQLADLFVAPRFPIGWALVRRNLQAVLDEALDDLPKWLGQ